MDARELRAILEACLATMNQPVAAGVLANAIGEEDVTPELVDATLRDMGKEWEEAGRGVRIEKVAGGWRMTTAPALEPFLRSLHGVTGTNRLSAAALEVLALVAYRQPITLPEINFIRGVNSSSALRTLLDRGLVRVAGRKKVVGKPFLYRTTSEFLVHFGLDTIGDLPKPQEILGEESSAAGVAGEIGEFQGRAEPAGHGGSA